MTDEIETLRDWHRAHSNIQRKLNIAGIDYNRSVMTMVEEAKQEILRLRREKAAMWELFKSYAKDRLEFELDLSNALTNTLSKEQSEEFFSLLERTDRL